MDWLDALAGGVHKTRGGRATVVVGGVWRACLVAADVTQDGCGCFFCRCKCSNLFHHFLALVWRLDPDSDVTVPGSFLSFFSRRMKYWVILPVLKSVLCVSRDDRW